MPIVPLPNCLPIDDLTVSLLALEQQVGIVTQSNLDDLNKIDTSTTDIDSANFLLDNLLQQAPAPQTGDEVSEAIGTPTEVPTQLEDEERLEELGLVLIKGILYLSSGTSNIENFRQLFFSLGSNMTLFLEQLGSSLPFIVTQNSLLVEQLPTAQNWTVEEARAYLKNPTIEKIYTSSDGNKYVVLLNFLAVNESRSTVAKKFSLPEEKIITRVFWLNKLNPDISNLNKLQSLGISDGERTATIAGETFFEASPTTVYNTKANINVLTGTAISQIELLNSRFLKIDSSSQRVFRNEIISSIESSLKEILVLQQEVRFFSLVISNPKEISTFFLKNSKDDLFYLFSDRRNVKGINFQATQDQIFSKMTQAFGITSGSTTLSSLAVNKNVVSIDPGIDQANKIQVETNAALLQMKHNPFQYENLQTAYACLKASLVSPVTPTTTTQQIGYSSYDSPASILARQIDWKMTFDTDGLLRTLEAAFRSTSLVKFVSAITKILGDMQNSISKVTSAYQKKIADLTSKLESFLTRYMSFFGTVTLNSSVLKCSLGYNIKPSLPILDQLAALIDTLSRKLRNVITELAQFIQGFISKLLCMPINLLNGFITGIDNSLPSFCNVNKVKLPKALDESLQKLRKSFSTQSILFQSYSRDILRVSVVTQALPAKLSGFSQSLSCESTQNSQFYKAATNSVTVGLGSSINPVAATNNALRGFGA